MFYKRKENKKGQIRFEVGDCYKDPLTGKWKTVTVSYYKNTSRARKQAELELQEKSKNESKAPRGYMNLRKLRCLVN